MRSHTELWYSANWMVQVIVGPSGVVSIKRHSGSISTMGTGWVASAIKTRADSGSDLGDPKVSHGVPLCWLQ